MRHHDRGPPRGRDRTQPSDQLRWSGAMRISHDTLGLSSARTAIENALFGAAKGWPGGGMIPPGTKDPPYLEVRRERLINRLVGAVPCFLIDIHETAFKTGNLAAALNLLAGSSIEAVKDCATP